MITQIEDKYKGLEVRDVYFGSKSILLHALLSNPGQEKNKKDVLKSTVYANTDSDIDD